MSDTKAISLEESLLGRLRLAQQEFRRSNPSPKSRFPNHIKELALEAASSGIAVDVIARALLTTTFRIQRWLQECTPSSKTSRQKAKPRMKPAQVSQMSTTALPPSRSAEFRQQVAILQLPSGARLVIPLC